MFHVSYLTNQDQILSEMGNCYSAEWIKAETLSFSLSLSAGASG
jgi:hypothetical protein